MKWVELTPDQVAERIVSCGHGRRLCRGHPSRCSTAALSIRSCACTFLTPATESALYHFLAMPGTAATRSRTGGLARGDWLLMP
jgi:hypothetical protein